MLNSLNFNNLKVDDNGRITFSGVGSGIDFGAALEGIIQAQRIPVDRIEAQIELREIEAAAIADLRGLLEILRAATDQLRGAVTFGNTSNVFKAKSAFATSSRTDGVAPAASGNLLGVTVDNSAAAASHTLEILRVAADHRIGSNSFNSLTSDLGTALGLAANSVSGTFIITGDNTKTVTVTSTDNLVTLRDRINAANSGSDATGVTASVVTVTSTEHILVLTRDKTGQSMVITDSASLLSQLGISGTKGASSSQTVLASSNIESGDGFQSFSFDGLQANQSFLVSYDGASKIMTLTRGDGTTDAVTLNSTAIASGKTETLSFTKFGATVVLNSSFTKTTSIAVAADTSSVTGGTILDSSIKITAATGDISDIDSKALVFNLSTAASAVITITNGGDNYVSAAFDATSTGVKTITLVDAGNSANTIIVSFDITGAFADSNTATITLNELDNVVAANATAFTNELQRAQTARFTADGLIDANRFESKFVSSSATQLSTVAKNTTFTDPAARFSIVVGGDTVTVSGIDATDTMASLVTAINAAITGSGGAVESAGTAASLLTDGSGVRLVITNTSGATIALTDTDNLLADLGVDNNLVVERASNTINDLFVGTTITLFQAEEGTTVKIDVEQDLAAAKTVITDFVNSFNGVKVFLNSQKQIDGDTGRVADISLLFGNRLLAQVDSDVVSLIGNTIGGIDSAFSVLAQIGINIVNNSTVTDPLLADTLTINDAALDKALLNNAEDVRKLFGFDFSSSDPDVVLLDFSAQTAFNASGYVLNVDFDDRLISSDITTTADFTRTDAEDSPGGPSGSGISDISFGIAVPTGTAFRYSYDGATEKLTVTNLTTGATETTDLTTTLDNFAGVGQELGATQTLSVTLSTVDVTITLTGAGSPTTNFKRGTSIITAGAIDVSGTITGSVGLAGASTLTVTHDTGAGTVDDATVKELKTSTDYVATTGLLTVNFNSPIAGVLNLAATDKIEFSVGGGGWFAAPVDDLDDGIAKTIDIRLVGTTKVIARIDADALTGNGGGAGTLVIDVGEGLFSETSIPTNSTVAMSDYLSSPALTAGSFKILDENLVQIGGDVAYLTSDSLDGLATKINAAVTDVTATVVSADGKFHLDIVLTATNSPISISGDTGNLTDSSHLNIAALTGSVNSANIDGLTSGASNGTVTVSGNVITVGSTSGAEGLKLIYNGTNDRSGITLNFTTGVSAAMFFALDQILDITSGAVDAEIDNLERQNKLAAESVKDMLDRIEIKRQVLLDKFIRAEVALTRMSRILETINQTTKALFANN